MKIVIIEPLGITNEKLVEALQPLEARGFEVVVYTRRTDNIELLGIRGEDADVVIVANQPIGADVLSKWKNLKMLSVAFTGVDHIDINYCKEHNIAVSNAAGYSTNAVAELTFGLAISVLRNINPCDNRCRNLGTKDGLVGGELFGKTFGIIGTGAIGCKVAKIAKAFDCNVIAYSRTEKEELKNLGIKYLPLEDVLKESHILSLHVPFNDETKQLLNSQRISMMKDGAFVINVTRGGVVDSSALADALNSGKLGGAGIDVFEMEPPIPTDHPLLNSKNTVITPHIAFASHEALFTRAEIVANNICLWADGNQQNKIC